MCIRGVGETILDETDRQTVGDYQPRTAVTPPISPQAVKHELRKLIVIAGLIGRQGGGGTAPARNPVSRWPDRGGRTESVGPNSRERALKGSG